MPARARALVHALIRPRRVVPVTLVFVALVAGAAAAPAGAVTQAATSCNGVLGRAATPEEPNLLRYRFGCTRPIVAYTLVVNRQPSNFSEVDDFSTDAVVLDPLGMVVSTESFGCEGTIPGAGVNCNGTAYPGHFVDGTFDTADPYCAFLPSKKPGTKPVQGAMVQLVVSDNTGAESGPFRLNLNRACPKVKAIPKAKAKPKGKHKTKTSKQGSTRRVGRR